MFTWMFPSCRQVKVSQVQLFSIQKLTNLNYNSLFRPCQQRKMLMSHHNVVFFCLNQVSTQLQRWREIFKEILSDISTTFIWQRYCYMGKIMDLSRKRCNSKGNKRKKTVCKDWREQMRVNAVSQRFPRSVCISWEAHRFERQVTLRSCVSSSDSAAGRIYLRGIKHTNTNIYTNHCTIYWEDLTRAPTFSFPPPHIQTKAEARNNLLHNTECDLMYRREFLL